MKSIKNILMGRDGMNSEDAEDLISNAIEQAQSYSDDRDMQAAFNVCQAYFGLSSVYYWELMEIGV